MATICAHSIVLSVVGRWHDMEERVQALASRHGYQELHDSEVLVLLVS